MTKFAYAFRYIDDLCWLNVGNAQIFLDPTQPRVMSNPYWIYPLHILDIKLELSCFSNKDTSHGIKAYFMNVLVSISDEESRIFTMQKFDKRRDLPFAYTQYIKLSSNRLVNHKQFQYCICLTTLILLYKKSIL